MEEKEVLNIQSQKLVQGKFSLSSAVYTSKW